MQSTFSEYQSGEDAVSDQKIETALISLSDKAGIISVATALKKQGVAILSSSGTMKHLAENGIEAEEISVYTSSPELLGGRVKTLHPRIHAGILADRSNGEHIAQLKEHGIKPIDLVVVNLYPFEGKYRGGGLSEEELCEFIDIGGVALIRAAAKNSQYVTILTHAGQHSAFMREFESTGTTTAELRKKFAGDAFSLTSSYDAAVQTFFQKMNSKEAFPPRIGIGLEKVSELRYGENPHQSAALYRTLEESPLLSIKQHQGKELSFNNYLDIVGAFSLGRDLGARSVSIIKHTNPCGAAWCGDALGSFHRALRSDRTSAFGGIVAVNGTVDGELAQEMNQIFLELVLARSYGEDALAAFSKKKNLRVIEIPDRFWDTIRQGSFALYVEQVFLMQTSDAGFPEEKELKVATRRAPTDAEKNSCIMAWRVAKHVKSNSIVLADDEGTVGIGAGQMSRLDAAQIATRKAFDANFSLLDTVAASDAFFPFADGLTTLAKAGITAVIQPGGSIRDQEVINAADAANVTMLFTGRRHFRHL
jgi:phosphoribosylaminoimidazolecarboxamide formyltransferase/IMP cyclohydrolase